ncbi:hypothetical protein AGMMS50212_00190 [Spirochaetia bacterium]|nr:hypothetical protein AGMMS50212_00190 [Spirochaetia bacterium]
MGVHGYENGFEFCILPERLEQPCLIKRPTTFFVNSMSDLFHENMTFYFLDKIFKTIIETPQHHYQILTKREAQNVAFFFKQWGTWGSDGKKRNKHANGKEINGKIYQSYPNAAKEETT